MKAGRRCREVMVRKIYFMNVSLEFQKLLVLRLMETKESDLLTGHINRARSRLKMPFKDDPTLALLH